MSRLIIIGAGGHGKVVADAAQIECVFLDASGSADNCIASIAELASVKTEGDSVIVAIGNNEKRLELLSTLDDLTTVVHPSAVVSKDAVLGLGTVVLAGAIVQPGVVMGRGCIINTGGTVDHDCKLGNGVHVSPGAHIGGDVSIGECSWIGIGASVKNGMIIGNGVIVGAGAAVVSDLPDGVTVVGVPAKELYS
jgi:sugar O-acyltransferase (sialic acid O-acetyltransferase NeuD family)